jgi:monofunctional biosynthetic peptidoglycan transglycosylase
VLPNPLRFRVERPSLYVTMRRDWILGQMYGLGGAAYLLSVTNPDERRIPDWAR